MPLAISSSRCHPPEYGWVEAVKMIVLHWHLSENQGFRVESKKYPKAP